MEIRKIKIGYDIDEVLGHFILAWHTLYPEISLKPKSWNLDPKIMDRFDTMRKNGTLDDFYLNIPILTKPEDIPIAPDCYITSRPVSTEVTKKWLIANGFPDKPVYSVPIRTSKLDAAIKAELDLFIDDSYSNFVELNDNGIYTLLFTAHHNVNYDVGDKRIDSLKDLPKYIKRIFN
jgi:hypothetical protein